MVEPSRSPQSVRQARGAAAGPNPGNRPAVSGQLWPKLRVSGPESYAGPSPRRGDFGNPSRTTSTLSGHVWKKVVPMKLLNWTAALVICCGSVSAQAGLFGCHKEASCCAPSSCCETPSCAAPCGTTPCCEEAAPSCCAPAGNGCCEAAPSCCAPAGNGCCEAAPSCCAPAGNGCCEAAPSCCAPAECAPACGNGCDNGCTSHSGCGMKKKSCLSKMFDCFKKKRTCHSSGCDNGCAPTCAAPGGCF